MLHIQDPLALSIDSMFWWAALFCCGILSHNTFQHSTWWLRIVLDYKCYIKIYKYCHGYLQPFILSTFYSILPVVTGVQNSLKFFSIPRCVTMRFKVSGFAVAVRQMICTPGYSPWSSFSFRYSGLNWWLASLMQCTWITKRFRKYLAWRLCRLDLSNACCPS